LGDLERFAPQHGPGNPLRGAMVRCYLAVQEGTWESTYVPSLLVRMDDVSVVCEPDGQGRRFTGNNHVPPCGLVAMSLLYGHGRLLAGHGSSDVRLPQAACDFMRQRGVMQDRIDAPQSVVRSDVHEAASPRHCCARCARTFPLASRPGAMLSYTLSYDGTNPSHRRSCDE
jgi:hypothetical protein